MGAVMADLVHRQQRQPDAATVADYDGCDRDYLLCRIEELEADLNATFRAQQAAEENNRKCADLFERAGCLLRWGRETVLPEVPDKPAKRGRQRRTPQPHDGGEG